MDSSPISPAIDGDVCDEDIFSSPLNRDAAGYGEEDDDGSLVDDSSAVAAAFEEEDDIDEAAYPEICDWNKFPPPPDDPKWRRNDFTVIPKLYFDKSRGDMQRLQSTGSISILQLRRMWQITQLSERIEMHPTIAHL